MHRVEAKRSHSPCSKYGLPSNMMATLASAPQSTWQMWTAHQQDGPNHLATSDPQSTQQTWTALQHVSPGSQCFVVHTAMLHSPAGKCGLPSNLMALIASGCVQCRPPPSPSTARHCSRPPPAPAGAASLRRDCHWAATPFSIHMLLAALAPLATDKSFVISLTPPSPSPVETPTTGRGAGQQNDRGVAVG